MRLRCIGSPSGSNARMGLMIPWEVCQVMPKHILKGKPRLNLNIIQEAQVRTCSRTSESNGCFRVVLGIRVDLMLEWDSCSHGRGVKQMRSRCIGNLRGSNALMALVIAWEGRFNGRKGLAIIWEVCQYISEYISNGKPRLKLKRIQEAQVRTCSRTSESNGCVRVVLGIRVDLMLQWDS
ncbi:uncharacterized protein G2W53_009893 [Senna tora]|uniref:Uncharacterized protein n=1 Tax=Senna tora TaxID=362788 RepID=A0A835C8Y1_9FABA|nr:uncharacterized protein G2W53_009893 [Senna tora]